MRKNRHTPEQIIAKLQEVTILSDRSSSRVLSLARPELLRMTQHVTSSSRGGRGESRRRRSGLPRP